MTGLTREQEVLLSLLASALNGGRAEGKTGEKADWNQVFSLAEEHAVLPLGRGDVRVHRASRRQTGHRAP